MVNKKGITLTILSVLHFFVDFICVSIMFIACKEVFEYEFSPLISIILYNCFAFLTQPFFGYLVDKIPEERREKVYKALVAISFAFIYLGILFFYFFARVLKHDVAYEIRPYFCAVILGVGNSLFHVVGGKVSLLMSNKATPGGIFVSTGAIGVAAASYYGVSRFLSDNQIEKFFLITLIPIIFVLLFVLIKFNTAKVKYDEDKKRGSVLLLLVLTLCIAIFIRSFLGSYANICYNHKRWEFIVYLGMVACLGKALGGVILDLLGPYPLIGISTGIAILFSILLIDPASGEAAYDYNGLAFTFGFNLLMPLTLDWLRKKYPHKEAFAFGLAAALLVPGYYLGNALKGHGLQNVIIPIVCLLTGAMLVFINIYKNKKQKDGIN